jgi:hypothetical protein
MDKSLWIVLAISIYNWFTFISNQIIWKRNPDSFGTPLIPFLGSLFLMLILWENIQENSLTTLKIILYSFIFLSELFSTLPFFLFMLKEATQNMKAIRVYPKQDQKMKRLDDNKSGAQISMIGDFAYFSNNNKRWFELTQYKGKPTLRFPVLWDIPDVSSITQATVLFEEASRVNDDYIEVPEENIYHIKVWIK